MSQINCIEYRAPLTLGANPVSEEILQCPDCSVELEIAGLNPIQTELAPEVEEDWGE